MNTLKGFSFLKGFGLAMLASVALLSGCGGGSADPAGVIQDSITISELTGTDDGAVGQTFQMKVKVVTTGDIPGNQITYVWEQTAGTPVATKSQVDGDHESTLSFTAAVTGSVTFKVTATTNSGKVASQSRSANVNP